jgi:hypothetical protein
MSLVSYKMTNDSGFAPNPFHGYLTLATCKPGIRRSGNRRIGDWIAGFTSTSLCGDPVGGERLIYLMRVDEILPIEEYFRDHRFQVKIPRKGSPDTIHRAGDNIYRPLVDSPSDGSDYEQIPNDSHPPGSKEHDVGGRNVLVAHPGHYFYFGSNALDIPRSLRPDVPVGQSGYGKITSDPLRTEDFIAYVTEAFDPTLGEFPDGLNGWPHSTCGRVGSFSPLESNDLPRQYASERGVRRRAGCAR